MLVCRYTHIRMYMCIYEYIYMYYRYLVLTQTSPLFSNIGCRVEKIWLFLKHMNKYEGKEHKDRIMILSVHCIHVCAPLIRIT